MLRSFFLCAVAVVAAARSDDDPFFGSAADSQVAGDSKGAAVVAPAPALLAANPVQLINTAAQGKFQAHPMERAFFEEESRAAWSYDVFDKRTGPLVWSQLDKSFEMCKEVTGSHQSPINLQDFTIASPRAPTLSPAYKPTQLLMRNTGNYLRLIPNQGSTLSYGDKVYGLVYISVHTPSEHTLGGDGLGANVPIEMQYVHKAVEDQELAVVSVLFEESAHPSSVLDLVLSQLPKKGDEKLSADAINLQLTLPMDVTQYDRGVRTGYPYLTYQGSLTTPPCKEDVRWFVLTKPNPVTKDQLQSLQDAFPTVSARPIAFKVDGRPVEMKGL